MVFREQLKTRIKAYLADDLVEVSHALDILSQSEDLELSNKEIGQVWERISKAVNVHFYNNEKHDAYLLEVELSKAYKYD